MKNTQSKHVASVMTCLGIWWHRVGPILYNVLRTYSGVPINSFLGWQVNEIFKPMASVRYSEALGATLLISEYICTSLLQSKHPDSFSTIIQFSGF